MKKGIKYNELKKKYFLKNGSVRLNSDKPDVFLIRFDQLEKLKLKKLPDEVKIEFDYNIPDWIFYDPIRVYVFYSIYKKNTNIFLSIQEKSSADYWNTPSKMNLYFNTKLENLQERQKLHFDLVVNRADFTDEDFVIEYVIEFNKLNYHEIKKMVLTISKSIQKNSFLLANDPYLGRPE